MSAPSRGAVRAPSTSNASGPAGLLVFSGLVAAAAGAVTAVTSSLMAIEVVGGLVAVGTWLRYPILLLISWAVLDPFIGSSLTIFSGHHLDTALTLPTLLLLLIFPVRQSLQRMPGLMFLLAFVIWAGLSVIVSPLSHTEFLKQWTLLVDYVAVAIIVLNTPFVRDRLTAFLWIALAPATGIALYGIYGYLRHKNVIVTPGSPDRILSVYSSAPPLASLLLTVLPLAIFLLFTRKSFERLAACGVVLILLLAVALTFTRGAFVALCVDMVVLFAFLPTWRARFALLIASTFALFGLLLTAAPLLSRFANADLSTLNNRTVVWQVLLQNFDPSQILGNGLGATNVLLQAYTLAGGAIARANTLSASNLYVTLLYNHGVVGAMLMLAAFVALTVGLIRRFLASSGSHRLLYAISLLVVINMLSLSVELDALLTQTVGVYFWLVLAIPFAVWSPARRETVQSEDAPRRSAPAA